MTRQLHRCKGCRTLTDRTCCRCGQPACWRCARKHLWPDGLPCVRRRRFGTTSPTAEPAVARPDLWYPERIERFRAFIPVRPHDVCWPWIGSRGRSGHGVYSFRESGRCLRVYAHRAVYILENGPLPNDVNVFHRCRGDLTCCNPDHLAAAPLGLRTQVQGFRCPAGDQHAWAKLTNAQVTEIRRLAGTVRARDLAQRFGVSNSHLHSILRGVSRRDVVSP
jgi:hypothetical protein